MGKENALGNDPLGWIKATIEDKKPSTTESPVQKEETPQEHGQQTDMQPQMKQHVFPYAGSDKPKSDAMPQTPSHKPGAATDAAPVRKPKVVIGKMYERPSHEKVKLVQTGAETSQEIPQTTKYPFPVSQSVRQMRQVQPEIQHIPQSSGMSVVTYIVIAYTALMLILGYFVYSDLSKRMSSLETKVSAIQKILRGK